MIPFEKQLTRTKPLEIAFQESEDVQKFFDIL